MNAFVTNVSYSTQSVFKTEFSPDGSVAPGGTAANEKSISCLPEDWVLTDGHYVLSVTAAKHRLGYNARVQGAENHTSGFREAVVSYLRLPDGTVLIYSDMPFSGKIFLKG